MLKKLFLLSLFGIIISFIINCVYVKYFHPESVFFSECIEKSKEWENHIRKKDEPCYIFAGGSEVRMSIDPEVMWSSHQIRAINAGIQASNGILCNLQSAWPFLQPNDYLVVSLYRFNYVPPPPHGGINFCFRHQGLDIFHPGFIKFNSQSILSLFFGDSTNYCIHLMRLITRPDNIYRYSTAKNARINQSGRVEVFLTNEQNNPPVNVSTAIQYPTHSPFLTHLKKVCQEKKVHLIAFMPRFHLTYHGSYKQNAIFALYLLHNGIPVLKDPLLGTWSDNKAFSDTGGHLSIDGGREFSRILAKLIKEKKFWTQHELLQIINAS